MDITEIISGASAGPYFIAEIGSNHNGNMDLAQTLIEAASLAGADCVKFQSWSHKSIFSEKKYVDNYFLADDYRDRKDINLKEIVKKYELKEEQHRLVKNFAVEANIDIASTPFSKAEADLIEKDLMPPFFKVASMDLNNIPLLQHIGAKNIPVVLSLGMGSLGEIDDAIQSLEQTGNKNIIILHCVAMYPPNDEDTNLRRIETLVSQYPDFVVGFSDHSIGNAIPLAAISLGARVIEKHFTIDNKLDGWDHHMSCTPEAFSELVSDAKRIVKALGNPRIFRTEDQERVNEFRRSIVVNKTLKKGAIISIDDLDAKRPGIGIAPNQINAVIGRKLARSVQYDSILDWNDLL